MKKTKHKPGLLWITGLSGSGKSTISKIIYTELKKNYSNIILLDGDVLRKKLKIKKMNTFSNIERTKIGLRYVKVCKNYINNQNKFVIIAAMALISKVQKEYKKISNSNDIFLDVPINELKKRDPKRLYKKFRNKEINNMVGLDLNYDKPKNPSLYFRWKKSLTANIISGKILKFLKHD